MFMLGSLVGVWILLAAPLAPPELNDRTYEQWRDHLRPKAEELHWHTVPWRSTFWDAVVEAQQKEKPILLWAMNGHPLACT
jgi:hypothetical protein